MNWGSELPAKVEQDLRSAAPASLRVLCLRIPPESPWAWAWLQGLTSVQQELQPSWGSQEGAFLLQHWLPSRRREASAAVALPLVLCPFSLDSCSRVFCNRTAPIKPSSVVVCKGNGCGEISVLSKHYKSICWEAFLYLKRRSLLLALRKNSFHMYLFAFMCNCRSNDTVSIHFWLVLEDEITIVTGFSHLRIWIISVFENKVHICSGLHSWMKFNCICHKAAELCGDV